MCIMLQHLNLLPYSCFLSDWLERGKATTTARIYGVTSHQRPRYLAELLSSSVRMPTLAWFETSSTVQTSRFEFGAGVISGRTESYTDLIWRLKVHFNGTLTL
jgi:hypothetical protein